MGKINISIDESNKMEIIKGKCVTLEERENGVLRYKDLSEVKLNDIVYVRYKQDWWIGKVVHITHVWVGVEIPNVETVDFYKSYVENGNLRKVVWNI